MHAWDLKKKKTSCTHLLLKPVMNLSDVAEVEELSEFQTMLARLVFLPPGGYRGWFPVFSSVFRDSGMILFLAITDTDIWSTKQI